MKKKSIVLGALTLLFAGTFAAACSSAQKAGELDGYTYHYHGVFEDGHDESVKIDGVLDDAIWQNKKYFTNTSAATNLSNDVHIGATLAMTEKGVYIGAYATDNSVQFISPFNENNSAFRFYLAPPEAEVNNAAYVKEFRVSRDTVKSNCGARHSSATRVENGIFTAEMFVSYEALRIDNSQYENGIVPQMKLYTVYRVVNDAAGNSYYDIYSGFGGTAQPTMYPLFDKDGYMNADKEGAVLGDAINGYAKTNGWELEEEPEGSVTVNGANWQVIYFKEAYASSFAVETYVEYLDEKSSGAKVGLLATVDQVNFRAYLLDASTGNLKENAEGGYGFRTARMYGLTYYPTATWHMDNITTDTSIPMDTFGNRVKLKMVKDGGKLYYFVNDEFVYSETCNYVSGKAFAGFYALGAHARYSDYSYTDLENNAEGLREALAGAVRIDVSANAGGSISADKIAAKAGGSFTIGFENWTGYSLASVKVNDREVINEIFVENGRFVLSDIDGDITVSASFEPLQNTKQAEFTVLGVNGEAIGASIYIEHDSDKRLFWKGDVPVTGKGWGIDLPEGDYTATVDAPGLRRKIYPFTVTDGENKFSPQLELAMIGNVETEDFSAASSTTGWDYSEEYLGRMTASQNANWEFVYFTGHYAESAIIKMTVTNTTPSGVEREKYPTALWTVFDGEHRVSLGVINQKIRAFHTTGTWDSTAAGGYTQTDANVLSKSFGSIGARLELMFIRHGGAYYIFEQTDGKYKLVYEAEELGSVTGKAVYGLTVCSDTSVALNVTFSDFYINSGADAIAEIEDYLAPEPPVDTGIFGDVAVNGKTVQTDVGGAIDYSQVNNAVPAISFIGSQLPAAAYFKDGATAGTVLVKTTIRNDWTSGDKYAQAGFMVNDGENKFAVLLIARKVRIYPQGVYTNSFICEPNADVLTGTMLGSASAAELEITFARYEDTYYLFEKSGGADKLVWSFSATDSRISHVSGETAIGLSVYQADGGSTIRFANFSCLTGTAAESALQSYPLPSETGAFGDVAVNGKTVVSDMSVVDYTEANGATPSVSFTNGKLPAAAYFKNAVSDTAVIKVTVRNIWTSGDKYAQAGFIINDGTNKVAITLIAQKVRVFPQGVYTGSAITEPNTNLLTGTMLGSADTKDLEITFARYNGNYYIFEKVGGADKLIWSFSATDSRIAQITGDAAYGFATQTADAGSTIKFGGYSVLTGSEAATEAARLLAANAG